VFAVHWMAARAIAIAQGGIRALFCAAPKSQSAARIHKRSRKFQKHWYLRRETGRSAARGVRIAASAIP
jgi:hypothetical protein